MKLDAQIVGNAGMYYASFRLSLLGWNVMPTARNARGVDLIVYDRTCSIMHGIQVKSLSKKSPVPLGSSLDKVMGDYWIIVNNLVVEPSVFILLPDEVKQLAHRGEKGSKVSYWLQPKSYDTEGYRNAWNRIGRGDTT